MEVRKTDVAQREERLCSIITRLLRALNDSNKRLAQEIEEMKEEYPSCGPSDGPIGPILEAFREHFEKIEEKRVFQVKQATTSDLATELYQDLLSGGSTPWAPDNRMNIDNMDIDERPGSGNNASSGGGTFLHDLEAANADSSSATALPHAVSLQGSTENSQSVANSGKIMSGSLFRANHRDSISDDADEPDIEEWEVDERGMERLPFYHAME